MALAHLVDDAAFDALYPADIQQLSRRYWTPVETARRAGALLRDAGARRLLDVGSGAGKFALVAAASAPELHVVGIEERAHLVDVARRAQANLGLTNVEFVHGNATAASWDSYDGLYFYNSFAENLFDVGARMDDKSELSVARFARDVQRAYAQLRAAKLGTVVATFYGSSGRVPTSFTLSHKEPAGAGWLRLWTKESVRDDGSFFIEVGDSIVRHDGPARTR